MMRSFRVNRLSTKLFSWYLLNKGGNGYDSAVMIHILERVIRRNCPSRSCRFLAHWHQHGTIRVPYHGCVTLFIRNFRTEGKYANHVSRLNLDLVVTWDLVRTNSAYVCFRNLILTNQSVPKWNEVIQSL
jgi:hypothetical protein